MPIGQRIVLGENCYRRTLAAELGAKRGLESADFALDLEPQFRRRLCQQISGEMLLELELGMLMDFVAERDRLVAVVIDRAGYFGMSVHWRAPLDAASIVSSTGDSDYPSFPPSLVEAHFFQQCDEARIGTHRVPVTSNLEVGQAIAPFLVRLIKKVQRGIVLAECEMNPSQPTPRNVSLRRWMIELLDDFARLLSISRLSVFETEEGYREGSGL